MTHELKTWPQFFEAIVDGRKTFELRVNDRGFNAGDQLRLREFKPESVFYTGRELLVDVTYVLPVDDKRVVMAIRQIERPIR
jgi:ASC-1-like (ASCH) protein